LAPPRLERLRTYLDDNNAVLFEYLWGDSAMFLLALDGDSTVFHSIPVSTELTRALQEFAAEVQTHPGDGYRKDRFERFVEHAHFLHSAFIGPASSLLRDPGKNLIISADGPLATFPFEALVTQVPEDHEVN